MKIGTTTIPLAGWVVDVSRPEEFRKRRLEAIRRIVKGYGLSSVELSLDFGIIFPQVFDESFYKSVAVLQKEFGITCTVHLPFMWIDCSSLNETIRQSSLECVRRAVDLSEPLYVDAYVLHLWGNTTIQITTALKESVQREMVLEAVLTQADRSLSEITKFINPINLCVETLEAPPFDLFAPVIEKHGTSICLDVGHIAYQLGGELSFLDRYQERIREIHLHDYLVESVGGFTRTIDHLALGKGQLDYRAFMQKLEEIQYNEVLILENNTQYDLEQSIARIADFL
jgi:sugar phosphate isomerase/epimerase